MAAGGSAKRLRAGVYRGCFFFKFIIPLSPRWRKYTFLPSPHHQCYLLLRSVSGFVIGADDERVGSIFDSFRKDEEGSFLFSEVFHL